MCGRFSLITQKHDLARALRIPLDAILQNLAPRYNIAPSQPVPILREADGPRMDLYRWGLIPSWSSDPRVGNRMINARGESLRSKPSFRDAFREQRCLVIADGFYEWLARSGGAKVPHYIRMKSSRPFTFAGLWSRWVSPAGEEVSSCTIVTSPPNELVRAIHDRMPVILPVANRDEWLDPGFHDEKALLSLLRPYPESEMEVIPVSRYVNSPDHEGPECIEPDPCGGEGPQLTLDLPPARPSPGRR